MSRRALLLAAAVLVGGCSSAADPVPADGPDIARIGEVVNAFPVTYRVAAVPRATLTAAMIDQAGALPAGVAIDPPRCRDWDTVLPDAAEGATVEGVEGTGDRLVSVLAVASPRPLPVVDRSGCDRIEVVSNGGPIGTAGRIPVPVIDGAVTDGYRADLRIGDTVVVLHTLRARLSDRLTVSVQSRAAAPRSDGLEAGLLTRAVAAVGGARQ